MGYINREALCSLCECERDREMETEWGNWGLVLQPEQYLLQKILRISCFCHTANQINCMFEIYSTWMIMYLSKCFGFGRFNKWKPFIIFYFFVQDKVKKVEIYSLIVLNGPVLSLWWFVSVKCMITFIFKVLLFGEFS